MQDGKIISHAEIIPHISHLSLLNLCERTITCWHTYGNVLELAEKNTELK